MRRLHSNYRKVFGVGFSLFAALSLNRCAMVETQSTNKQLEIPATETKKTKEMKKSNEMKGHSNPCEYLPLLKKYNYAGLIKSAKKTEYKIAVSADLHGADCGTPDSYGTNLKITVKVRERANKCMLDSIVVEYEEFGDSGFAKKAKGREEFLPTIKDMNLTHLGAGEIVSYNRKKNKALIIDSENILWFDDVEPKGELHRYLAGYDEEENSVCCWGATSSLLFKWAPESDEE